MTNNQLVQQHPASIDAYVRHGWSLVPIPPGTKGPRTTGWNLKENAVASQAALPPGYGIGLAHAYSGTMALDIDNWTSAIGELTSHGVDLHALYTAPDAVIIDSGRPGHGKLLYAMPDGLTLPSKKIILDGVTSYELRCATSNDRTVQDVLPPSIHPDTQQPYRWAGNGHWTRIPLLPQPLLDLWRQIINAEKQRTVAIEGALPTSWHDIKAALSHITPDCSRDDWVGIGMARVVGSRR